LDQKKKTNKEEEGTKVSDGREERAPPEATRGGGEGVEVWGSVNRWIFAYMYPKDFFVNNEGVMKVARFEDRSRSLPHDTGTVVCVQVGTQ